MLKLQIFSLVAIFFIFISVDLSEAKGGRGGGSRGGGRGRFRGGGWSGVWYGDSFDFAVIFWLLFGIAMVLCICCVCSLEDDAYENSLIKDVTMKEEHHDDYQNNETTINMGLLEAPIPPPKNKFLVHHKSPATYSERNSYLPYPIAPNNVPTPVPGHQFNSEAKISSNLLYPIASV